MTETIHSGIYTARKKYRDDLWDEITEWIDSGYYVPGKYVGTPGKISFADARILVKWRNDPNNKWILPGMKYERQFNKYDGNTRTLRMRKEMYDIACRYDVFDND